MTTASQDQGHAADPNEHGGSNDRSLSKAVGIMLLILAIVMGILVPIGMYLLHGATY